ncbi:MAG: uroporphyrinogen decarboxylase family protein [Oscillospiraceae bacterium]
MNSIERFYATVARKPVDRPAAWLGMPDILAQKSLFAEYEVSDLDALKKAVDDDFYAVEVPYHATNADAIYAAFDWYGDGVVDSHDRTLTSAGCFQDAETQADIADFAWPNPQQNISPDACRRNVDMVPDGKVALGILWSAHFQDTCAAFGMENALVNMLTNPDIYKAVDNKIVEFYLQANQIFFEATKHRLNAVLIGNDLGSQRGLMLSPELVREFIIPGAKRLIAQAHSYGLKVIYHSCGSIDAIIPDLIAAGVDVIHPIQALATGMDPRSLQERFGETVSFCGGVDTQELLVHGSTEDVKNKVRELRTIFRTGLILSPSHEAILPDVPPENIRALFEEAKKAYDAQS